MLWSVALRIGALTKLGLFFPVVCFIDVFDQTLAEQAEQLYRDKGLLHCERDRFPSGDNRNLTRKSEGIVRLITSLYNERTV